MDWQNNLSSVLENIEGSLTELEKSLSASNDKYVDNIVGQLLLKFNDKLTSVEKSIKRDTNISKTVDNGFKDLNH